MLVEGVQKAWWSLSYHVLRGLFGEQDWYVW
jgi:hypothetical protein